MYANIELAVGDVIHALEQLGGSIEEPLSDHDLTRLADRAIVMIMSRTEKGLDYKDKPFVPYSDPYRDIREESGRVVDRVTLRYTGTMWASISRAADGGMARIYFSNADMGRIANYHNSMEPRSRMPLRRFLALDEGTSDYRKLANMAAKMLATRLNT